MQPPGQFSVVFFRNRTLKPQFWSHFNFHAALITKLLIFHQYSHNFRQNKKETHVLYKQQKGKRKLKIQQPSSLTFPSYLLKVSKKIVETRPCPQISRGPCLNSEQFKSEVRYVCRRCIRKFTISCQAPCF